MRKVGIMAYGTQEDRWRLEALSRAQHKSSSQWIVDTIRKEYEALFGASDPAPTSDEEKMRERCYGR